MLDGFAESPSRVAVVHSSRGFVTHTGTFGGVPVSIIATGMGLAMADFVARELRACVDATAADPVLLVRLGTCGSMAPNVPVGMLQDANGMLQVSFFTCLFTYISRSAYFLAGSVAVANLGSISVRRNPSAFGGYDEASASTEAPYLFYAPIASDAALNEQACFCVSVSNFHLSSLLFCNNIFMASE